MVAVGHVYPRDKLRYFWIQISTDSLIPNIAHLPFLETKKNLTSDLVVRGPR